MEPGTKRVLEVGGSSAGAILFAVLAYWQGRDGDFLQMSFSVFCLMCFIIAFLRSLIKAG